MRGSEGTRRLLLAYGYTTETLAIDLDVKQSEARRILHGKGDLMLSDIGLLANALDASVNFLSGIDEPGTVRKNRQERASRNGGAVA